MSLVYLFLRLHLEVGWTYPADVDNTGQEQKQKCSLFHVSVVFCLLTSQSEIFPWGWSPEVEQKTPPSAEYMQGHTLQSVDTELDLVSKG